MPTRRTRRVLLSTLLALGLTAGLHASAAQAGEVKVAVAANFTAAAKEIGTAFTKATGDTAVFSFGSTGQLFTQVSQDAPFEVFLAADQARPKKAETQGFAVAGSRFTYATGAIVLYSADPKLVTGKATLSDKRVSKLAIANPVTAPYGAAAVQALKKLGVYDRMKGKLVRGTNIAQTYQFVVTGNAPAGIVALSEVATVDTGSRWVIPAGLYDPIRQGAVLLKRGADNPAARAFIDFLRGPEAGAIKKKYGYGTGS